MKYLLPLLLTSVLLTGCLGGGGGGGGSNSSSGTETGTGADTTSYANSGSAITSDLASGSGSDSGNVPAHHNPEPSTLIMFGIGLAGLTATALRKKRKQTKR